MRKTGGERRRRNDSESCIGEVKQLISEKKEAYSRFLTGNWEGCGRDK